MEQYISVKVHYVGVYLYNWDPTVKVDSHFNYSVPNSVSKTSVFLVLICPEEDYSTVL